MRKLHLVCNAHLDPVWLWQRQEGMAEAASTFRIAADFCEKYDGFVFNHNEAVLYEWVFENEPELFERIKKLVKKGKWKIMGGWYLQPDAVMPCGESIIRQIEVGNKFFNEHFGGVSETAIGFDAFGHSRGLVQILKKCGYKNYVYMRPRKAGCESFIWEGFDGSRINTFRLYDWYNTPKGEALERIKKYNKEMPDKELNVLTWGIGNHGGGPSEKDLNDINNFAAQCEDTKIIHSDFDSYFNELDKSDLKIENTSRTHCMVGCYTTMVRVKQAHRRLENKLNLCEKMLWQSGIEHGEEKKAEKALLFGEFHDILPGTSIKRVEEDSLRLLGYGEEIAERYISKAFFKLCRGQKKAKDGEIPVMIYNPHPYPIESEFEAEFQLAEQNRPENGIFNVSVYGENGESIPSQLEQEDSAHFMDWRKKIVFRAVAEPMSITRFDCRLERDMNFVKIKPCKEENNIIILKNNRLEIRINKLNGNIEKYAIDGKNIIKSVSLKTYKDSPDPWGMQVDEFNELCGEFVLTEPIKVIENGDVRTKLQSVWKNGASTAVMTYIFSKNSAYTDIDVKILSAEENVMHKLCIETELSKEAKAYCETMFGTEETHKDGKESVFQKWCGLKDENDFVSVLNNGTYGGSFKDGEIRLSLVRTPVYSAHPDEGVKQILDDRKYDHIDMGERNFSFRICVNEQFTDCEASIFNQKPYILAFFPSGDGEKTEKAVKIDNKHIILTALKNNEKGTLIRLYNSSPEKQTCSVNICGDILRANFNKFEVKTFVKDGKNITETNMLGQ